MCPVRVEAHDVAMFNDYETRRALVAERQTRLRNEARSHRLSWSARRRARRNGAEVRTAAEERAAA
jgi:hypothetical protein